MRLPLVLALALLCGCAANKPAADAAAAKPAGAPAANPADAPAAKPADTQVPAGFGSVGAQQQTAAAAPQPQAGKPLDSWANGAVVYEVFVRSFRDSDGDGKGDFKGLISKLDYLNDGDPKTDTDLGVDAVWLMPVFGSPSYHGYDTTDYDHVNPDYGTDEDFALFLREAHKRGIKVIVDLVINHTGVDHPWFTESASSPTSPKRDWYVWSPTKLAWGQPWNPAGNTWHEKNGAYYYGLFWAGMPDLNLRNAAVRAEVKRIAKEWLDRGVDGFRLDAIRHLIETGPGEAGQNDTAETHAFLKEFSAYVRSVKADAALVGEAWTDTKTIAPYYGSTAQVAGGDELPLNFDFPLAGAILDAAKTGDAAPVAKKLADVQRTYPAGATDVPFLTNHDMRRVASVLGDDAGKLRSAAAVLLTLPGTPFLYYGEEVGLQNGKANNDEAKRTPMPWDGTPGAGFTTGKPWFGLAPGHETENVAAETRDPGSLLSRYRQLIRLRHAQPVLAHGALETVAGSGPVLAFLRTAGAERLLVAHNLAGAAQEQVLRLPAAPGDVLFADTGASVTATDGGVRVALPPHGSAVVRLR